jgi:hypothetical protein
MRRIQKKVYVNFDSEVGALPNDEYLPEYTAEVVFSRYSVDDVYDMTICKIENTDGDPVNPKLFKKEELDKIEKEAFFLYSVGRFDESNY